MLTYRTNILFDAETKHILKQLAQKHKTTIGKLVRAAVKESYLISDPYTKRKQAWEHILQVRPPVSKEPINYKELITYGRKY